MSLIIGSTIFHWLQQDQCQKLFIFSQQSNSHLCSTSLRLSADVWNLAYLLATPASFDEGFAIKTTCSKCFCACLFPFRNWTLDFLCKPVRSFTHTLSTRFDPQTFRFHFRLLLCLLPEQKSIFLVYVGQLLDRNIVCSSTLQSGLFQSGRALSVQDAGMPLKVGGGNASAGCNGCGRHNLAPWAGLG